VLTKPALFTPGIDGAVAEADFASGVTVLVLERGTLIALRADVVWIRGASDEAEVAHRVAVFVLQFDALVLFGTAGSFFFGIADLAVGPFGVDADGVLHLTDLLEGAGIGTLATTSHAGALFAFLGGVPAVVIHLASGSAAVRGFVAVHLGHAAVAGGGAFTFVFAFAVDRVAVLALGAVADALGARREAAPVVADLTIGATAIGATRGAEAVSADDVSAEAVEVSVALSGVAAVAARGYALLAAAELDAVVAAVTVEDGAAGLGAEAAAGAGDVKTELAFGTALVVEDAGFALRRAWFAEPGAGIAVLVAEAVAAIDTNLFAVSLDAEAATAIAALRCWAVGAFGAAQCFGAAARAGVAEQAKRGAALLAALGNALTTLELADLVGIAARTGGRAGELALVGEVFVWELALVWQLLTLVDGQLGVIIAGEHQHGEANDQRQREGLVIAHEEAPWSVISRVGPCGDRL
jgi:hypothetical protein